MVGGLVTKDRSHRIQVSSRLAVTLGVSAVTAFGVAKLIRRNAERPLDLRGKVVLITGGSRGLGFALAQQLGKEGARLALCARSESDLNEACARLSRRGVEAKSFRCDLANELEIKPLVTRVIDQFGKIDVLLNNAGYINVGPVGSFDHSDFERAMNVMFWAPMNLSFAVLSQMRRQGCGHIVNITSVGGRVSVPHLLPYSCAKFALFGFSTGLSAELHSQGIHVLTVVPGLMRTGSYLNAEFRGTAKNEFAWFSLLGNLPGFSIAAEYAAKRIVAAMKRRRQTCTISLPANILIRSEAMFPESTRNLLTIINRFALPHSTEKEKVPGKILNPAFSTVFQALTSLGRSAAQRLNE